MANIFREIGDSGEIFRDESTLQPDYMPTAVVNRDAEIKDIAFALRGAGKGMKPENVIAVGKPGTGKTVTVKYILNELKESSNRVETIYINCWEFSTRHAVLNKICMDLRVFMPRRGIAADEIFERIVEVLKKEKKVAVVALDEVDRLLAGRNDEERVLYDLLRAGETYGTQFGVVGITNNEDFVSKLDSRIRSSLAQKEVLFKPYNPLQMKGILGDRAKIAFQDGVVGDEVVPVCAANAAKNGGDARLGISMLHKAGKIAEREGARKVDVAHCKKAFVDAEKAVREERLAGLNEVERRILEIAGKGDGVISGELYETLAKEFKETDRTVRNYLDKLETLKLISVGERERGSGQKGNTRVIRSSR